MDNSSTLLQRAPDIGGGNHLGGAVLATQSDRVLVDAVYILSTLDFVVVVSAR